MKIWATIRNDHRITQQYECDISVNNIWTEDELQSALIVVCEALDLERPIILAKHVQQLNDYAKTSFVQVDFLDTIAFDAFDIELLDSKKTMPSERARILNDFSNA